MLRDRRRRADRRNIPGTGGLIEGGLERLRGIEGRDLMIGGLIIAVGTAVVTVVNALTVQVDNPEVAAWEPWVWEGTSAVVVVLLAWLPWLSTAGAPPEMVRDGWRARAVFAGVHLTVAAIWSALHVVGMMGLRLAIYGWVGAGPYEPGPAGEVYLYEFRKDLISYAAFVGQFWILRRLHRPDQPTLRPVSFDIRDGARIIRAPVGDILAVSSAQNYVEFWLADGRRPLMRATLAAIEVELEAYGFVRSHRSWLVNGGAGHRPGPRRLRRLDGRTGPGPRPPVAPLPGSPGAPQELAGFNQAIVTHSSPPESGQQ